ncbi:MAG: hypothetical protein OEZ25_04115 [Candidatus Bathyarchaeota archaeon]|nr:hypothetical protein [Candidatus Bathyarchaeota archaeon]
MKNRLYWSVLLLTILMSIVFIVAFFHYLPILRRVFPSLRWRPSDLILSDLLFMEAGMILVTGAMLAGYSLYKITSLNPLKSEYWKTMLNWKILLKESGISPALGIGLTLIGFGIIYILLAVIITLF